MLKDYKFINLFRAIAAFWVMIYHCFLWGGWLVGFPVPDAKIAVDLFMVISGFVMAAGAYTRKETEPITRYQGWISFYMRRFFRIAPAYYLSLFLASIMGSNFLFGYKILQKFEWDFWSRLPMVEPMTISYSLDNILMHLSFLFGLFPKYASLATWLPDWSLSLEMQFYLTFPILLILMLRIGPAVFGITATALSLTAGYYLLNRIFYLEPSVLLFKLQFFIAGILCFQALLALSKGKFKIPLLLISVSVVLASINIRHFGYGLLSLISPVLLILMFVLGCMEIQNKLPRWIQSGIISFASDTSYSVYLFHGFFISLSGYLIKSIDHLSGLTSIHRALFVFTFVAPLTYASAYMIYRCVEQPGIRLGRKAFDWISRNGYL